MSFQNQFCLVNNLFEGLLYADRKVIGLGYFSFRLGLQILFQKFLSCTPNQTNLKG
ncbi:hypothetical protein SAMN02746095_02712 [Acidocella aminolytica 101 = DSM 11237]|nr:hypothetical protein SAMN02746095_02712 [Acidocella aminolytica 101 = DSM 11237]